MKRLGRLLLSGLMVGASLGAAPGVPIARAGVPVVPTSAAIEALGASLPDGPFDSAGALVDQVLGANEAAAVVAVAEVLRASGIPLVSGDGPVVALPAPILIPSAALYVPWTVDLAEAVRRGDGYSLAALTDGLKGMGFLPETFDPVDLGRALARWGKEPDAPRASVVAAAVVRGLSARRGELFTSRVDPEAVSLDPLQTTLILAHLLGDAAETAPVTADRGSALAAAAGSDSGPMTAQGGPCDGLASAADSSPQGKDAVKTVIREAIGSTVSKATKEVITTGWTTWDTGAEVLTVLLLAMGAQLDLDADKRETHFKHAPGDPGAHVRLKATATFHSSLAGTLLKCYALAGIKVPPDGPIKDFRVAWMLEQAKAAYSQHGTGTTPFPLFQSGKYLTVASKDSKKICVRLSCGDPTDANGTSTLELYPPVEKKPGKDALLYGRVRVSATLSLADTPTMGKLSDLLKVTKLVVSRADVAGVGAVAVKKIIDASLGFLKRASLPERKLTITVGYHGQDAYRVKGEGLAFLLYWSAPFSVDIYTCEGLRKGTWLGKAQVKADQNGWGAAAEWVTAKLGHPVDVPDYRPGPVKIQKRYDLLAAPEAIMDLVPPFLVGHVSIDARPEETILTDPKGKGQAAEHIDGVVGTDELYFGPVSVDQLLGLFALGVGTFPVVGVPSDPRCEGGGPDDYYYEQY